MDPSFITFLVSAVLAFGGIVFASTAGMVAKDGITYSENGKTRLASMRFKRANSCLLLSACFMLAALLVAVQSGAMQ